MEKGKTAPGEIELINYSMWFDCAGISRGGGLLANKCKVPINFWFSLPLPILSPCTFSFRSIMCTAFMSVIESFWCCVWALSLPAHHCVISRLCGVVYAQCALSRRVSFVIGGSSDVSPVWNMLPAHHDNSVYGVRSLCQPSIVKQGVC